MLGDSGELVAGVSTTLNSGDSLTGGAGQDVLALFGSGQFHLDTLTAFSGFEEVQLINATSSPAELFLRDGVDISVVGSGSGTKIYNLGTGNETIIGGSVQDQFWVRGGANDLTAGDVLDGGDGNDSLFFQSLPSGTTIDIRGISLQNIESLHSFSNITLLVDQASLDGFTSLSGSTTQLVTDEATLDLTGKSVSNVTIASSNATTGTLFTVDNSNTALQIIGGPGDDTLNAPTLTFTSEQRDSIFAGGGVETIIDSTGIYGNSGPNTLIGTAGNDSIFGGGGDDRLEGGLGGDILAGGPDADTFAFAANFGQDTIIDFLPNVDTIEFTTAVFADATAALNATADDGQGNTVITLDVDNTIELEAVLKAQLAVDDFAFV